MSIGSGNTALYPDNNGMSNLSGNPGEPLPSELSPYGASPGASLPSNDMLNISGSSPKKKHTALKWLIGLATGMGAIVLAVWGSRRYAMNKFIDKSIAVVNEPTSKVSEFIDKLFSHLDSSGKLASITKDSAPDALKKSWWARRGGTKFLEILREAYVNPSSEKLKKLIEKFGSRIKDPDLQSRYSELQTEMLENHTRYHNKAN